MNLRIGHGYDIHRTRPGGRMVLGGVVVDEDRSLIAYSDGDVVAHAVVDAIIGALGQGDIGRHFPQSDARWKDAPGSRLLHSVVDLARRHQMSVVNIDVTILAELPRLAPHIPEMVKWLREITGGHANIKAGTNEGCDAVGRGEAICATAVVMLAASRGD